MTVYVERGASWWPVLWGPAFAAVAVAVESATPGPRHPVTWTVVAALLSALAVVWVLGRRRLCSVHLTDSALTAGSEQLPVSRIAAIAEAEVPVGAHVLGGGAIAPKGTGEVPLKLHDDSVVIAWAKNPDALTRHLRSVLAAS